MLSLRDKLNITDDYNEISIKTNETDMTIFLPVKYLIRDYNKNLTRYGATVYNKYPLLPINNKNISSNILSLRLFDNTENDIDIKNLDQTIIILIKKTRSDYKFCVFLDNSNPKNM